ncbi:MAG: beta-galactosidase [Elusimicrobiales bacterium]
MGIKKLLPLAAALLCLAGAASAAGTDPSRGQILLGAAWYPEQWPQSQWDQDLARMEAAHITVARIGEFAWSAMEPSEGAYDLDWLNTAIRKAEAHHIYIVLGTPTAAPPAWLTRKYPETLRIDENGKTAAHGNRQQFSFTNPRYRELSRKIAGEMAKRFGNDPNVIGWQIDNEYCQLSYDPHTANLFRGWLKDKYGSLDNINNRWATRYWSQTYDDWNEIPFAPAYHSPAERLNWVWAGTPSAGPDSINNPALRLEANRFGNVVWADYQQNQLDEIRKHASPGQFITSNFLGFLLPAFDGYPVAKNLTLAAWDDYIVTGHADPAYNGLQHDYTRGLKRRNFWVMETQPAMVNWFAVNSSLDKGETRALAWEAVGHGADAVSYWQWRSALNGQEQYHGTLVGADGSPVPVYDEVRQIGEEFAKAGKLISGTGPVSKIAFLYAPENRWAIDFQQHTAAYDQFAVLKNFYKAFRDVSQSVDVINPAESFDGYAVIVAPSLNMLPQETARRLADYVRGGGRLVLGPRAAMKDEFNALLPQRQPGWLADALGGRVEQFYALEKAVPVSGELGSGQATVWAEQLSASAAGAKTLLSYGKSNGWLDGAPAVLSRDYGKGGITYIGAVLDDALLASLARRLAGESGVKPAFGPVPEGVEVCPRESENGRIFILINFGGDEARFALPRKMKSLLTGEDAAALTLPRYGVVVLLDK